MNDLRPVPGFPGYSVDAEGDVYSSLCKFSLTWVIRPNVYRKLKPALTHGYPGVHLQKNGRAYWRSVHRLICEVFHGSQPTSQHWVGHLNDIKTDNRACNLMWVLPKTNTAQAIANGRWDPRRGERSPLAKLTSENVLRIRVMVAAGMTHRACGQLFGVTRRAIGEIVNRRNWAHV